MPPIKTPEGILKTLRRLEGNKICPNCGHFSEFGYGSVCVKYKTFVCDLCKTSHQAISHRVKSLTMSTWTLEEANEMTDEMGGGNDAARHIWLQNAPNVGGRYNGGYRPKDGDKIEIFKKFIEDCYERQIFKSNEPYQPKNGVSASTTAATSTHQHSSQVKAVANSKNNNSNNSSSSQNIPSQQIPRQAVTAPVVASTPVAAPEVSLIDFLDDPLPPTNNTSATTAAAAVTNDFFNSNTNSANNSNGYNTNQNNNFNKNNDLLLMDSPQQPQYQQQQYQQQQSQLQQHSNFGDFQTASHAAAPHSSSAFDNSWTEFASAPPSIVPSPTHSVPTSMAPSPSHSIHANLNNAIYFTNNGNNGNMNSSYDAYGNNGITPSSSITSVQMLQPQPQQSQYPQQPNNNFNGMTQAQISTGTGTGTGTSTPNLPPSYEASPRVVAPVTANSTAAVAALLDMFNHVPPPPALNVMARPTSASNISCMYVDSPMPMPLLPQQPMMPSMMMAMQQQQHPPQQPQQYLPPQQQQYPSFQQLQQQQYPMNMGQNMSGGMTQYQPQQYQQTQGIAMLPSPLQMQQQQQPMPQMYGGSNNNNNNNMNANTGYYSGHSSSTNLQQQQVPTAAAPDQFGFVQNLINL